MKFVRYYVLAHAGDRIVTKDHEEADVLVAFGWQVIRVEDYPA